MSLPQIRAFLAELKLSGMQSHLDGCLESARTHQWTPEETLDALLQAEVDARRQRAFAHRLRTSRLRASPAFEDLDLSVRRSLSKTTVRDIASLSWLRDGRPLVLIGQTGVGKTFLAQAAGHRACQEGKTVLFLSVTHWLEQLQEARTSHTFLRFRDRMLRPDLLVLDDFGMKKLTAGEAEDFREILEERSFGKSLLLTTQLPFAHWGEVIPDPVLLEALVDRIESPALVVTITGESYRKKNARREKGAIASVDPES